MRAQYDLREYSGLCRTAIWQAEPKLDLHYFVWSGGIPDHELTDSLYGNGKAALHMTARTGVQSSLPFSRSFRSEHTPDLSTRRRCSPERSDR